MKALGVLYSRRILAIVIIACFLFPTFYIDSVRAQGGPFLSEESRNGLNPFSVNGSLLETVPQSYVGGYMSFDEDLDTYEEARASALNLTVSFRGTDKSVIQGDNWLSSGICAQGPSGLFGIDWGYTIELTLDGLVDYPYIQGKVFKCYEWGRNGRWPFEPPAIDLAYDWNWWWPGVLGIDSDVTLAMSWIGNSLHWFAEIDGVQYDLNSYPAEQYEWPYFMLGTCRREWGVIPLGGTVKFFQFMGACSAYNIGGTGWVSTLTGPHFLMTNETEWKPVSFGFAVQGPDAYFDHTCLWGGARYDDVCARYEDAYTDHWCHRVTFYPSTIDPTLETDTKLWANHPPDPPAPPSGRNTGYAGISYKYSAVTWDPDAGVGGVVRYEFDWDDGTRTITDWYYRGFSVLVSKVWEWPQLSYHIKVRAQDQFGVYSSWSYPLSAIAVFGPGDTADGWTVDIFDAVAVANWFGDTYPPAPIRVDVIPDRIIDIFDIVIVASNFGKEYSYHHGLTDLPDPPETQPLTDQSTLVSVSPDQIIVCKDQTFSVNVTVTNVTSLYGWEFKAYWNSTILNLTSAQVYTPGIWGQDTFVAGAGIQNDFNETHGRYWKAMSALNPAPSFNGSMTLVTLTFEALETGTTQLGLQDTKLADPEALAIDHDAFGSTVTVIPYPLYMRSDQHTINNATMYKLMETHTQNGISTSVYTGDPENDVAGYWGIRVWKRSANGTEVELTSGSPVAVVSRSTVGQGLQSATWACPATSLNPTDSMVVRVYYKFDFQSSYTLSSQFSTVQLNATQLTEETWIIYYYTRRSYNTQNHRTTIYYYWDNTYLSRIENLDYD